MRLFTLALAATTLIAGMAEAHGPSRQKTTQEVVLNAAPNEVWQAVGNFGDLSWMPGVAAVDAPQGNEKDGIRTVTLDSGTVLTEELTKYDAEKRTMSFRMTKDDIEAIPVTNFSTVLTVKDEGGKALVEMRGGFYRGFPNNDPPPDLNDDAAVAAVNAHYRAALDGLVERFGQ
ncbi:SRPBCC family protein [Cereibacter sp. SYSU M97828]|nr:SRPBCC family protein [Cereibacter flavus]